MFVLSVLVVHGFGWEPLFAEVAWVDAVARVLHVSVLGVVVLPNARRTRPSLVRIATLKIWKRNHNYKPPKFLEIFALTFNRGIRLQVAVYFPIWEINLFRQKICQMA